LIILQAHSSAVEHCFDVAGVSGSIPLAPNLGKQMTNKRDNKSDKTMFKAHEKDTGSMAIQIVQLTERINHLNKHFESFPKDKAGRMGLMKLVGQRRSSLEYLKKHDEAQYRQVIDQLSLRR
jgi:small subunit ribosomal protein S15